MMKELSLEQCQGLKFLGYACSWTSGQAVLVFEGEVFAVLEARSDYDECLSVEEGKLKLREFGDDQLVKAGLISREEIEAQSKARRERFRAMQELQDYKEYKCLKRKFEGGGS